MTAQGLGGRSEATEAGNPVLAAVLPHARQENHQKLKQAYLLNLELAILFKLTPASAASRTSRR